MLKSRSSINEFAVTITQCVVGLARLSALLFMLQLAIFAAIGPASSAATSGIGEAGSSAVFEHSHFPGVADGSVMALEGAMRSVDGLVQVVAPFTVVVLMPLLCLLVVLSPLIPHLECRYLFLALLTVVGLLPLILFDLPSAPWAAGALPHLSNSLLIGGVVPLVATISMMSVAILLARRTQSHDVERMIPNPAASRVTPGPGRVQVVGGKSEITSSPRHRRML